MSTHQKALIALETCTPVGGVSLYLQGRGVAESIVVDSPRAQSVEIAQAVKTLMQQYTLDWSEIAAIAVSTGPGSFTGVRLGLSLAKGICLTGTPRLIEVSTLKALAWRSLPLLKNQQHVIPLFNAKKGEVYGQVFQLNAECLSPVTKPFVALVEDFSRIFKAFPNALFTGAGCVEYHVQILNEALGCSFASKDILHPHPETVALLGWEKFKNQEFSDPANVGPFYLRDASVSTPKKIRSTPV
ncbi:MAG: tRNA (adenosine(37)-N6)-threonylcarbamoyltransferase complex dimerization subunit type 1 TsaB [Sumerlaeia bacterium]